jgi:hypothetical protein
MNKTSRLAYFPISFFAVVMGLTGLCIAWENAELTFELPFRLENALLPFTAVVFISLVLLYLVKLFRYPQEVIKELNHPVKLNFFPAVSISLILLSIAILKTLPDLSLLLWGLGTALHLGFTLYVMNVWIHHDKFEIHHISPAWFIPVVGNVLVPITGTAHGYAEISWFFFSIGILFWVVLFTIIFYRVLFHHPLPDKLMPTFFYPDRAARRWLYLLYQAGRGSRQLRPCALLLRPVPDPPAADPGVTLFPPAVLSLLVGLLLSVGRHHHRHPADVPYPPSGGVCADRLAVAVDPDTGGDLPALPHHAGSGP